MGGTRPRRERKRRAAGWSEAQCAQLERCLAAGQSYEAIAAEIGRTPGAVKARGERFHLERPNVRPTLRWTPERETLLAQRWNENVRVPEIAAELGRSQGTVIRKAGALGLPGRHAMLDVRRRPGRLPVSLPAYAV
jgi:hypothetical protein